MGGSMHDARVKNIAKHDAQPSEIIMHGARNTGVHFCVMNSQVSMSYIPNVAFNMSLSEMGRLPKIRNRLRLLLLIDFLNDNRLQVQLLYFFLKSTRLRLRLCVCVCVCLCCIYSI